MPQVYVNGAYHLFSALSIKNHHPMAGQKREEGGTSAIQGRNGEREEGREREGERERGRKIEPPGGRRGNIIRVQLEHGRP